MNCPECGNELKQAQWFYPGGVTTDGLPKDWYSPHDETTTGRHLQEGGECFGSHGHKIYIRVKSGQIYQWKGDIWKLLSIKNRKTISKPIGGVWI